MGVALETFINLDHTSDSSGFIALNIQNG